MWCNVFIMSSLLLWRGKLISTAAKPHQKEGIHYTLLMLLLSCVIKHAPWQKEDRLREREGEREGERERKRRHFKRCPITSHQHIGVTLLMERKLCVYGYNYEEKDKCEERREERRERGRGGWEKRWFITKSGERNIKRGAYIQQKA